MPTLRKLGEGACGSVWGYPSPSPNPSPATAASMDSLAGASAGKSGSGSTSAETSASSSSTRSSRKPIPILSRSAVIASVFCQNGRSNPSASSLPSHRQSVFKIPCFPSSSCSPTSSASASASAHHDHGRSLLNDALQPSHATSTLASLTSLRNSPSYSVQNLQVLIPEYRGFVTPACEQWWSEHGREFPQGLVGGRGRRERRCKVLVSERLPSFGEEVRERLIHAFCPEEREDSARSEAEGAGANCVITPFLGRRSYQFSGSSTSSCFFDESSDESAAEAELEAEVETSKSPTVSVRKKSYFSLRNCTLCLDDLRSLGILGGDLEHYVRTMAETLAAMHWIGRVDATDVKFVLAPPRVGRISRDPRKSKCVNVASLFECNGAEVGEKTENFGDDGVFENVLGRHRIWLLDFDRVRPIQMNETGIKQAVRAFEAGEPFFPRPGCGQRLWGVFKNKYLSTSQCIVAMDGGKNGMEGLPELFIRELENGALWHLCNGWRRCKGDDEEGFWEEWLDGQEDDEGRELLRVLSGN